MSNAAANSLICVDKKSNVLVARLGSALGLSGLQTFYSRKQADRLVYRPIAVIPTAIGTSRDRPPPSP